MLLKIRSLASGLSFPSWSFPIALLALTLLSYGLRALTLGFFWDDWPYLWFFHRLGPQGIVDAFSGDRPFLSFIYILSLSVLGSSGLNWQIFAVIARWLCALGLWWALAATWPQHKHKSAWAAALFAVYPGFTQQWIALIYGQAFFLFALQLFSIGLTVWLARRRFTLRRWQIAALTLLALALSGITMFSTEYFFGVELLRPVLLWLVFTNTRAQSPAAQPVLTLRQRAGCVVLWWAPYLALMIAFVIWRGLLHPFTGYGLTTLEAARSSPLATLWQLALTIVEDALVATGAAWGQPLQILPGLLEDDPSSGLRLLVLIILVAAAFGLYFARLRPGGSPAPAQSPAVSEEKPLNWALQASAAGLLALLASGWPIWLSGLQMRMGFPLDRYALAMSVGASLLLVGLIDALGKNLARKAAVIGLAVGMAAGFHLDTALAYEIDWKYARDFFWQLSWRAPAVQANTVFASAGMPFQFFEDDSLTAPLNWTYDPDGSAVDMPYILYDLQVRSQSMPQDKPGRPVARDFRATDFQGSTSQVILFYYSPPGCVRILDPRYDADLYRLPDRLIRALHLSNPGALIQDHNPPAAPPAAIFGTEPRHRWCYYYEKAELARQREDWQAVVELSSQSIRAGFRPEDPVEYLPFIEGYARARRFDDAFELTARTESLDPSLRPALCAVWERTIAEHPDLPAGISEPLNNAYGCSIP